MLDKQGFTNCNAKTPHRDGPNTTEVTKLWIKKIGVLNGKSVTSAIHFAKRNGVFFTTIENAKLKTIDQ